MKDQELMERLKNEAVDVPESLKPEAIETLLEKKARVRGSMWKKTAVAAAVFFIICGSIFGVSRIGHMDTEKTGTTGGQGAESYDSIYELLKTFDYGINEAKVIMDKDVDQLYDMESSGEQMATAKSESTGERGYSGTNVQTAQVDEGDVVKTDGKYLYVLDQSYNTLSIVQAEKEKLEKKSVIELDEDFSPMEFYVAGNQLVIVGDEWKKASSETQIRTYDIRNREKPGEPEIVTQSGDLRSSRMKDGYLYVFSGYSPQFPIMKTKPEQYVPMVCDQLVEMPRILVPEKAESPKYLVMTAIDLKKPDRTCDRQALFSSGEIFYVSSGNIYAASGSNGKNTEIRKFSYEKGQIEYQARGSVKGYMEDSFSMDEHEGYLRLVTTLDTANGGSFNNVYVLDDNMKETGSILKLAKDERIYSARFMGDKGYFVTFRETDPLFSVDFSDPSKPKIIGRLKIPGFSEYLHFYAGGKLLGIGMSTDKEGNPEHVKLSMFDISDPKNVKETDVHVIKDSYSAEVLYDHHAAMIDQGKNLIGFSTESNEKACYYLFQYDEGGKGFQQVMRVPLGQSGYSVRGVYIGEYFYLIESDRIRAYGLDDFKKAGEVKI